MPRPTGRRRRPELSCADPLAPCSLTNFFVGDPTLQRVVARTLRRPDCAGARHVPTDGSRLDWNLGLFRTNSDDDILFVASETVGPGILSQRRFHAASRCRGWPAVPHGSPPCLRQVRVDRRHIPDGVDAEQREQPTRRRKRQYIQARPGSRLPGVPPTSSRWGLTTASPRSGSLDFSALVASGRFSDR